MKKIEAVVNLMELFDTVGFNFERIEESETISEEKCKKILETFGFNEKDNVELNDFLEFSRIFGFNKEKYLKLKPLKDKADVTWEQISNIKYGDIDFENNTIYFTEQKVKHKKDRDLRG